MKCRRCENIICFSKPPFGAYFCKGDHVQCAECDLMSSNCVCGETTKYKSPHFIDEHTTDPKELNCAKLQIPIMREISPTKDEEAEFQKLRYEFTMGKPNNFLGLKMVDELGTVRTLSAIITKNLHTTGEEKSKTEITDSSNHELRLQRIMRALRETRCSANEKKPNETATNKQQKCNEQINAKPESKKFVNLLIPTYSKVESADKKFLHKIHVKVETGTESADEFAPEKHGDSKTITGNKLKSLICPHLAEKKSTGLPMTIEALSLDRRPFSCSLGNCGSKIFISELNQHITLDHPSMPLAQLKIGRFREISIDIVSCENYFAPVSVVCFLLKNVVVNFGASPLKDVLPLFLMVGRYTACDALDKPKTVNSDSNLNRPWSNKDFFLIWVAGVVPDRCEIVVSISVFSQENSTQSVRWYVDRVNSIQAIEDVETTFNSCERLILSYPELKFLTNNFKDMLQCQVGVISCELKTI